MPRTNKKTNKRMRGGNLFAMHPPNGFNKFAGQALSQRPLLTSNGNPKQGHYMEGVPNRNVGDIRFASNKSLSDSGMGFLEGRQGGKFWPNKGGRRRPRKGLSRKSAKKVKKCVKKASRKKSAKARRSGTRKCMKLKKRLSKH